MNTTKIPNFIHDKPLFGLDIGHGSMKVMQLQPLGNNQNIKDKHPQIVGYGFTYFDKAAQQDGVIIDHEVIANAALDLFKNNLVGDITTRRVAIAIPTYRTFIRSLQLPKLKTGEIQAAVELEAEQYIPTALSDLYLDYEVIRQTADTTELLVVAVPRKIVDSYLELAQILNLEPILIEPTLSASSRLFSLDKQSGEPTLLIDFGSMSSDISIVDKKILVTGTVQGGGENFTQSIKSKLNVTPEEAGIIKTRYGLGMSKRQGEIRSALEPTLQQILKEIRRMMRYYEERYGSDRPIRQIVTLGGGANMPGLSEYMTENMRLAVRHSDPWEYIQYKGLEPPKAADKPMYATVAGLSLANPKQVFEL
jgi:type IV pilus assembly protein PilM